MYSDPYCRKLNPGGPRRGGNEDRTVRWRALITSVVSINRILAVAIRPPDPTPKAGREMGTPR